MRPSHPEVIRNTLRHRQRNGGGPQRTSYNMMIYEVCDFCTALTDASGTTHLAECRWCVPLRRRSRRSSSRIHRARRADGSDPEDVFITITSVAGQHLNNVVIYMPFLHMGKLMGFAMTRAHWIDVGGSSTGLEPAWSATRGSRGCRIDRCASTSRQAQQDPARDDPRQHPVPGILPGRYACTDCGMPAGITGLRNSSSAIHPKWSKAPSRRSIARRKCAAATWWAHPGRHL